MSREGRESGKGRRLAKSRGTRVPKYGDRSWVVFMHYRQRQEGQVLAYDVRDALGKHRGLAPELP